MSGHSIKVVAIGALLVAGLAQAVTAGDGGSGAMTKSYAVADLVVPLQKAAGTAAESPATLESQLIRVITATVAPETWSVQGGRGTIDYFANTMSLVVCQTAEVQDQVNKLLQSLRRLQDVQVCVEVRLVEMGDDFFERIGVDFQPQVVNPRDAGANPAPQVVVHQGPGALVEAIRHGSAYLNDNQLRSLLEVIQGDSRTNVMQAPKVTVANGQAADLQIGESHYFVTGVDVSRTDQGTTFVPKNEKIQLGFRMTLQPAVSADRRCVYLYYRQEDKKLASPAVPLFPTQVPCEDSKGKTTNFTQFIQQPTISTAVLEKTAGIPDGATLVLVGPRRDVEVHAETATPVLSRVPYVNRLFKNFGYGRESRQTLVLITPRILVSEEEEKATSPEDRAAKTAQAVQGYKALQSVCPGTRLAGLAVRAAAPDAEPTPHEGEEQEVRDTPAVRTAPAAANPHLACAVTELLRAYDAACAAGKTDEADRLARAALALDPTCFHKKR